MCFISSIIFYDNLKNIQQYINTNILHIYDKKKNIEKSFEFKNLQIFQRTDVVSKITSCDKYTIKHKNGRKEMKTKVGWKEGRKEDRKRDICTYVK